MKSKYVYGICLIGTIIAQGWALNFYDNFSDTAATKLNWAPLNSTNLTINYKSGVYSVTNSDQTYSALISHTLSPKPTTFTFSGKITRSSASTAAAGFYYCMSTSGGVGGYTVQLGEHPWLFVQKYRTNGTMVEMLKVQTGYLIQGTNEIEIRKQGTTFNVLCNGYLVGSYTDNEFPSGDIAMLVPPKSSITFDDIKIVDQYTIPPETTSFRDDFNDNIPLFGWANFVDEAQIAESQQMLSITTAAGKATYEYTNIRLDQSFVSRVETKFVSGNQESMYGFFLMGDNNPIPVAAFAINGKRFYSSFILGDTIRPQMSTSIKGAASTAFDTLEVIKRQNSSEYLFVVNKDTLSRFSGVNFSVVGAGVFCLSGITINFDNFLVEQGSVPIQIPVVKRSRSLLPSNRLTDRGLFNPLGQMLYSSPVNNNKEKNKPGLYIQKDRGTIHLLSR